jgi:esterase/lipase
MPKVMMTNISNTSNNNRQISNYMNPYNLHYNNLVNTRKLQNKISKNINIISLENNIVQKHTQNLIG